MDESGFGIEADLIIASILVFAMCALMLQRVSGFVGGASEEFGREELALKAIAVSNALLLGRDENFPALGSAWLDPDKRRVVAKTIDAWLLEEIAQSQSAVLGLSRLEIFFGNERKTVFWNGRESANCVALRRLARERQSGKPIEITVRACDG